MKKSHSNFVMALIVILSALPIGGCGSTTPQAAPTHTPVPPTVSPTNIPPTPGSTPEPGSFEDSGQRLGDAVSWAVSMGDLDGDGDLDAFVGNDGDAGTGNAVWLNDGGTQGGTLGLFVDSGQTLGSASGLELGDLDGDGDLDAFTVFYKKNGSVWMNDGRGIFSDSGQILANTIGFSVDLGDVDGDGDLDAFVGAMHANTVWLNNGQGVFVDSGQRLGAAITADVVLGDLDKDDDLDALTGGWDEPARVWLNDGTGIFVDSGHNLSAAAVHIHGIDLGDVDGDGDLDAFMAVASGDPNEVWYNDGAGTFVNSGQGLYSALGHDVSLVDLDGDGDLDAFMANGTRGGAGNTVWLNDGQGAFTNSGQSLGDALSMSVSLGDLDGDEDIDAFVVNYIYGEPPEGESNRVWLNTTPLTTSAGSATGLIAFLSDREANVAELYVMDAPGGTGAASADPRRLADGFIVGPSWSPDGQRIAYTRMVPDESGRLDNHGPFEIWVTTRDGDENLNLSGDITDRILALPWPTPTWTPDGTRLAFIAAHETDGGDLLSSVYVVATDGSGLDWSLPLPWLAFDVFWSPLGNELLLVGFEEETDSSIHTLSLENRNLTEIYQGAYAADWSPNGSEIVIVSYQPPDVLILDAEGEPRTIALIEGRFPLAVKWSPDGGHVVVGSSHSSNLMKITALHLISLETGEITSLVTYSDEKYIYAPNWSPTGDHLLYTTTEINRIRQGDTPYADLWVYDLISGEIQRLTSGEFHDGMGVWSP